MSQNIALARGTSANEDAQTFQVGVIRGDTDLNNLRFHDGVTPGGHVIPNETQIGLLVVRQFLATLTDSTPGAMDAVDINGNLVFLNAAGDYEFPPLADFDVGQQIRVQATTASVTISCNGSEEFEDQGTDSPTLSLTENEIVTIAKKSPTRWIVTGRY